MTLLSIMRRPEWEWHLLCALSLPPEERMTLTDWCCNSGCEVMFYSICKDRSVPHHPSTAADTTAQPPTSIPALASSFILYGSAKCWELVKCCQSLIFFSPAVTAEWWQWWLKESGFLSFSPSLRGLKREILAPLQDSPSRRSSSCSLPPLALFSPFLPSLPSSLPPPPTPLTNGINRPWNNQCWWSILEPVDMLMSKPHRYCCRVINHCLLPECIAAGAANPGPGIKHCLLTINVQTFCCPVPWLFSDAKKVGRIVNQ